MRRLAQGNPLNQPYGFAIASNDFGPLSNTLFISNNTNSGTINGSTYRPENSFGRSSMPRASRL